MIFHLYVKDDVFVNTKATFGGFVSRYFNANLCRHIFTSIVIMSPETGDMVSRRDNLFSY